MLMMTMVKVLAAGYAAAAASRRRRGSQRLSRRHDASRHVLAAPLACSPILTPDLHRKNTSHRHRQTFNISGFISPSYVFSSSTLLVGQQEGHPACKKTEWWGAGVVICLERGADLHKAQLMPLPLTVSCYSKIQIGFTFLVPAHLGSPGRTAVKRVLLLLFTILYGSRK